MGNITFTDAKGSFCLEDAGSFGEMYFPLAGEGGLKSAVTADLMGDAKLDQNHFLMEPVSSENLHNNRSARNFWCRLSDGRIWSVSGHSAAQQALKYTDQEEKLTVLAGYMWHSVERKGTEVPLLGTVTSFVPFQKNMEIHIVCIENTGSEAICMTPVAAMPIYGRSADNIRDHRHVTSLLHRIQVKEGGIQVKPTFSFDERGHQLNHDIYFVYGMSEDGGLPEEYFPVLDDFIGEKGNLEWPEALLMKREGVKPGYQINGQEALGGLVFGERTLEPGESCSYVVFSGIVHSQKEIDMLLSDYLDITGVELELEKIKQYWGNKVNIHFHTADQQFDQFMSWISFQPELRRIYGCSFLPHHDYGKGGRGWRDLWQDCLALLLMNPGGVRQMLLGNFEGVRIDGSNATIIGERTGEFKADRNAIVRMWMDHGVWPYLTTRLYIDQTGDLDILNQQAEYFKDGLAKRSAGTDPLWKEEVSRQQDKRGRSYQGSILEHLLLQNLTAFYEVGEHNHIRLRNADWNDALDMAADRGESVAFSNAYAGNLTGLAELVEELVKRGQKEFLFLQEMEMLLTDDPALYEDRARKLELLDGYLDSCIHTISGNRICVDGRELAEGLRHKGEWIREHIRKTEWVTDQQGNGWFNGYYDNHGKALEGVYQGKIHMMLTSQVFSIMNGTATDDQVKKIIQSARKYLFDPACGGYRLNTDFGEIRTDMGRMFGFAYGEKENGGVFSHMAVMYANALYQRGFAREGMEALMTLYGQSMNMEESHIYPGIPEYFGRGGRGLYHYLTGAASWYLLTTLTYMFGIRGELGDLLIEPKLLEQQFDEEGEVSVQLKFGGKNLRVRIENKNRVPYEKYTVAWANLDGEFLPCEPKKVRIPAEKIRMLEECGEHVIKVNLE